MNSVVKSLSSLKTYEIVLLAVFFLMIVLPYSIPYWLAFYIDSAIGMIILFVITLALFYYCHPLLGVVYLFVSYDILRRSSNVVPHVPLIPTTPTQDKKDAEMNRMNPPKSMTLEEEIIATNAPIDGSKSGLSLVAEPSSFRPVYG